MTMMMVVVVAMMMALMQVNTAMKDFDVNGDGVLSFGERHSKQPSGCALASIPVTAAALPFCSFPALACTIVASSHRPTLLPSHPPQGSSWPCFASPRASGIQLMRRRRYPVHGCMMSSWPRCMHLIDPAAPMHVHVSLLAPHACTAPSLQAKCLQLAAKFDPSTEKLANDASIVQALPTSAPLPCPQPVSCGCSTA